jgi:hypothetical protein
MEDEKDIPISVKCKYCDSNLFKIWIWHGIKIYQCRDCETVSIEGEVE